MDIKTVADLDEAIASGKYTSVGGYPIYFITDDGGVLSYDTVKEEYDQIAESVRDQLSDGWNVTAADINWEDTELLDDHTGNPIESAYGDDDDDNEDDEP